ncbi:MAG: alpha/beta hydrolase [Mycobacterium sp.]
MPAADIHPELRRIARFVPRQIVYSWSVPLLRRLPSTRRPGNFKAEALTLPSGAGVRLFRPSGSSGQAPALLWIHGGGYVIGDAAQDDDTCRAFADRSGIVVASVEYRLAPEHPYPIPVEDCYSVLTWLAALPGVDADRIAIGGASAGGGLAAALAFVARDRGDVKPVLQILSYPMLDDRTVDPALDDPGFRLWNTASNRIGWRSFLGGADPAVAVPARREDLAGLPPAWLGVGTLDLFHREGLAYAERLQAAGVACEVHEVPGAFHGFDKIAPKTSIARSYFNSKCASLRQAVTPVS